MRKTRILITAYDCRPMLGGIATFVDEICKIFAADSQLEIRLIARQIAGEAESEYAYDQAQNFKVRRVALHHRPELSVFTLVKAIREEAENFKPDLVLNFLWLPEAIATYFAVKKIPYFVVAHGVEVMEGSANLRKKIRRLFSPVKRLVFQRAAGVLVNSRYTGKLVEKNCGVASAKITCVYAGVSPEKFTPGPKPETLLRRYGLSGKKVLFTITRLIDYKGIDFTLRSLPKILNAHPDLVYLIGGIGEDESRLRQIVRELKLESSVKFLGKIPDDELEAHYQLCDAFVMLSREDYLTPNVEGFGLVFLEAAACEKPVIGGRSGGISDALEDQVTGILVDPCDIDDIAVKVSALFNDSRRMRELGTQGRLRVLSNFTWQKVADRFLTKLKSAKVKE